MTSMSAFAFKSVPAMSVKDSKHLMNSCLDSPSTEASGIVGSLGFEYRLYVDRARLMLRGSGGFFSGVVGGSGILLASSATSLIGGPIMAARLSSSSDDGLPGLAGAGL